MRFSFVSSLFFFFIQCCALVFYAYPENSTSQMVSGQEVVGNSISERMTSPLERPLAEPLRKPSGDAKPWSFVKVKIKGSLLQKERFLRFYLFEPGDVFDEEKHKHSLKNIVEALVSEGYLAAAVKDAVNYDQKTKTVSVTLTLNPGTRYTIGAIKVELAGGSPQGTRLVSEELQKMVERDVARKFAEKEMLDVEAQRMRTYLLKAGYARPNIMLTSVRDAVQSKLDVTFTIELPPKKLYLFEGNQFYTTEFLLSELLALEAQGISLEPSLIVEDLEALYKKKGFFSSKIRWDEKPGTVKFYISEGPRTRFCKAPENKQPCVKLSITTRAQEGVPMLENNEVPLVDSIKKITDGIAALEYYDEDALSQVLMQASSELVTLGYWDVVIDKVVEHDHTMLIDIILGTQRLVQQIAVEGYPDLSKEEPFRHFVGLKEPRPLSREEMQVQKKWLLSYFRQRGFLQVTVEPQFVGPQSVETHLAEPFLKEAAAGPLLLWRIDLHAGPVRFGPTTIAGLQKIRPAVVLREMAYGEGDIWSREKIDETIKRLKALCMFESISISPFGNANEQVQPMIIRLVEDDPYEIRTRLGVQFVSKSFTHLSWTTYKIGGSFVWKNPTGMADRLWADVDFTRYSRNIGLQYEVPWIGNWPVRTMMRAYSDRFDQPFISKRNHRLYKEAHDGVSVTFHHTHPWYYGCVKVGFELNKLSDISRDAVRAIQFEPTLVNVRTPYFYLEPSITFERLDDKNDPSRGFLTNLACRAMFPFGIKDAWFIRAVLEQSFFYPLWRNVIGGLHARLGHIFNAHFSSILPTERFYLGGACSLRGYETNMVPPLNDLRCDGTCFWVPIGGKSMANVNAEIRFPLYKRLSGVVFTDLGILTQDRFADIAANRWFGASGFGLRFATPIAPIRFDIGWKWRKREQKDKAYAWFLTLGHAF